MAATGSPAPNPTQPSTPEITNAPDTTRTPIEIDLVNGNGDVDLTNGVTNNDASTEVDLTTDDSTTEDSGTTATEEVDDLFDGYDGYDYDPSEYDDLNTDQESQRDLDIRNGGPLVETVGGIPTYGAERNGKLINEPKIDLRALGFGDAPIEEDYSDRTNPRQGKTPLNLGSFEPATLEVDAPFFEYSELESEAQELEDRRNGDEDEDVEFISVPLMIEELGGGSEGVRGGDPTVILAGSPPEDEEDNYDNSDYFGDNSSSEEPNGNTVTATPESAVTVRGFVRGRGFNTGRRHRNNPVGRGAKEGAIDTSPNAGTTARPRVGNKRVEDIPKEAFHSFLVDPPQASQNSNQKKRGVDWSQKLREKRRKRIWKQFRLN